MLYIYECWNVLYYACTLLREKSMSLFGPPGVGYGHPGRWIKSVEVTGTFEPTSSATYGVAGFLISGSASGIVTLSDSGGIPLAAFDAGIIHEASVQKLEVSSGTVYALYKRYTAD